MQHAVLDLFAGTGVGVAIKQLGGKEYGVEIMPAAIASREANGMETVYNDVWDAHLAEVLEFDTLWASPPCQSFSLAGKGAGRKALDDVLGIIEREQYLDIAGLRAQSDLLGDDRTGLVLSPLHYAARFRPTYIALEQVPPVLPVWQAMKPELEAMGYSVWVGYLHAEQYGVPQTRKRAYLIARRDGTQATPPKKLQGTLAMEDVITPRGTHLSHGTRDQSSVRKVSQPAATMAFGNDIGSFRWVNRDEYGSNYDAVKASKEKLTLDEAKILQSYPVDFFFAGNKFEQSKQIGNAVPPLVAEAVLAELWGSN